MPKTLLLALLVGVTEIALCAQDVPDLRGQWALESSKIADTITITQTGTELRIEGVRGFFEGTAVETYKLDGSKVFYVQDFGEWWRKSETQMKWEGSTLVMRLRVIGGWWRDRRPDEEKLDHPHGDTTRILTVDSSGRKITVETLVVSGNPPPESLKSTQVFTRIEPVPSGRSQTIPDFSGSWTGDPARTVTLRNINVLPGGWGDFAAAIRKTQPYVLTIVQTSNQLEINFPGSTRNILNTDLYNLDGSRTTYVHDVGDFWRKFITQAIWDGTTVTLNATRQVEWWKNAQPSAVTHQDAQTDSVYVLRLSESGTELTITTTLTDEKGEVEYRQAFKKAP